MTELRYTIARKLHRADKEETLSPANRERKASRERKTRQEIRTAAAANREYIESVRLTRKRSA